MRVSNTVCGKETNKYYKLMQYTEKEFNFCTIIYYRTILVCNVDNRKLARLSRDTIVAGFAVFCSLMSLNAANYLLIF